MAPAFGIRTRPTESGRLLQDEMAACQLRPEHIYRHRWRMGDMLVYDNTRFLRRREALAGARFLKATRLFADSGLFARPG